MKFNDLHTKDGNNYWEYLFVSCQSNVILNEQCFEDISDCVKLCDDLQISDNNKCNVQDIINIFKLPSLFRRFSELM